MVLMLMLARTLHVELLRLQAKTAAVGSDVNRRVLRVAGERFCSHGSSLSCHESFIVDVMYASLELAVSQET